MSPPSSGSCAHFTPAEFLTDWRKLRSDGVPGSFRKYWGGSSEYGSWVILSSVYRVEISICWMFIAYIYLLSISISILLSIPDLARWRQHQETTPDERHPQDPSDVPWDLQMTMPRWLELGWMKVGGSWWAKEVPGGLLYYGIRPH